MRWRTFTIRSLLIVMLAAAMFFGGYRLGWQQGRKGRPVANFEELIKLIETTVKPESWGTAGGSAKFNSQPGCPIVVPVSDDPFAAPLPADGTGGQAASDDPFASPPVRGR
jgi:hypothetical protein